MSVDFARIRKYKLCVATPMYGGMCNNHYLNSMLALQNVCYQTGITLGISGVYNQSIVSFARNDIANAFLETDFTHLLFVDADIGFNPDDIVRLLHFNKDIIGIPCSHKAIEWSNVKEAILKNPDIELDEIPKYAGRPNYFVKQGAEIKVFEPTEVERIGTGIMMIKRCVFEKMISKYPQIKYINEKNGKKYYAFFHQIINNSYDVYLKDKEPTNNYFSEDFSFCKMWRKIGGSIWMCPWMMTTHTGNYEYNLNLLAISSLYEKSENENGLKK